MATPPVLRVYMAVLTVGIVWFLGLLFVVAVFRPWLRVLMSGGKVSAVELVAMRLRGNPPALLIDAYLTLLASDSAVAMTTVEKVYVAHKSQILSSDDLVRLVLQERARAA